MFHRIRYGHWANWGYWLPNGDGGVICSRCEEKALKEWQENE